jgi:ribose-phosphate pyrophosphokinase
MDKKLVKVFAGKGSENLAADVAKNLKIGLGQYELQKFSDGEQLPVFKENIRGRTVFLIQSTNAPFENYWELFQMVDAAKKASAKEIIAVIPYYGYGRQDRKDQPRVCISAKLIANFLETAGANRVITIDLHADQIVGFFDIKVDQLQASYVFVPYLKSLNLDNMVVASPDTGGTKRAKSLAGHLGVEMVICYKHRIEANKIDEMILIGDVKGKNVVIVDDIIDTGGTLCKAAQLMIDKGALSVRAVITHPIMSGEAYENIEKSVLSELIVTDTIPLKKKCNKITVISVSTLLSRAIRNIVNNKSISKLFLNGHK